MTFGRSGKSATVDGATTLLEAGENEGVLMPFGCRMGICQSCVVMIDKGAVRDLRTGVEHVEGERAQTCVSAAAGIARSTCEASRSQTSETAKGGLPRSYGDRGDTISHGRRGGTRTEGCVGGGLSARRRCRRCRSRGACCGCETLVFAV